jgi:hypothetical protein
VVDGRLLLLGVITAPTSFDARSWQRQHYSRLPVSVTVQFVLGNMSRCRHSAEPQALLRTEMEKHSRYFVVLTAHDCRPTAVAHKTLAWYRYAASVSLSYRWVGKSDDDSLVHMEKLVRDLVVMGDLARKHGGGSVHAYYGTLRWRLWLQPHAVRTSPIAGKGNCHAKIGCACGTQSDAWPPDSGYTRHLMKMDVRPGHECHGAVGPFPYADGSLNVMSSQLVWDALARPGSADDFVGTTHWTHEDVGIAYLVFRQTSLLQLPTVYFTLQNWVHNLRWMDARDTHSALLVEHALAVHRVKNAMHAELVSDLFDQAHRSRDSFACGACDEWGWNVEEAVAMARPSLPPLRSLTCCHKAPVACRPGSACINRSTDWRVAKMQRQNVRFAVRPTRSWLTPTVSRA